MDESETRGKHRRYFQQDRLIAFVSDVFEIPDDISINHQPPFFQIRAFNYLVRNLPESSKIVQCTFGNMPFSSKCSKRFRWSFIFMACTSCQVVIFPHLNRWKYQFPTVLNFPQKCPSEDLGGFGVVRVCGLYHQRAHVLSTSNARCENTHFRTPPSRIRIRTENKVSGFITLNVTHYRSAAVIWEHAPSTAHSKPFFKFRTFNHCLKDIIFIRDHEVHKLLQMKTHVISERQFVNYTVVLLSLPEPVSCSHWLDRS